ncbi:MAG TPA: bifunctional oligoribonuclease/PAP phosphatase NrnA [Anaerovoracaceae bacterium]|nr:bifunctional oligoribonuclease/PAP phosphatase NrnA [Anaerovoracaceae bacterium]
MKKNNTYKEVAREILKANDILLFPHINIDGDAMGSSAALCKGLRGLGKNVFILVEDEISDNLKFLENDYVIKESNVIAEPDLNICVDCGEDTRFPKRKEKYYSGKTTMCIDHHGTSMGIADYNIIESNAAATGELVYLLLKELNVEFDKDISNSLFTAITMDTGNFQYANTDARAHLIVADLYNYGLEANKVSVNIYENNSWAQIKTEAMVLENLQFYEGGKLAIGKVTKDILEKTGCKMNETEGIVKTIRGISGVEIATLIKQDGMLKTRASFRAKYDADVSKVAKSFGGGGHVKAAGCTIDDDIETATELITKRLIKEIKGYNED